MASKKYHYQHIYSSVENKAPLRGDIQTAEIAVNCFPGKEKLYTKNASGDVISFYKDYIVELTQAEYDQLVEDDEIDPRLFYVITDAEPSEGKIYDAGRAIKITSGTSADTIDFDLPIYSGSGDNAIEICDSGNTASGSHSVAEGKGTTASGYFSHSEGQASTASGTHSHSEGYGTTASGNKSHSEGEASQSKGTSSHAEGYGSIASGTSSHAEGQQTTAKANYSHSEGYLTEANGEASHAQGEFTKANNKGELASGIYNVSTKNDDFFGDSGNTLFSLGNGGNNSTRHNAFEVKEDGSVYYADLSGGTNYYDRPMLKLQDEFEKKMDKQSFINSLYPKGSIYQTTGNTNPSTFIGGEWQLMDTTAEKETLWEGSVGQGTTETISLSGSIYDYDVIEFTYTYNGTFRTSFYVESDRLIPEYLFPISWASSTDRRGIISAITSDGKSLTVNNANNTLIEIRGINGGLNKDDIYTWQRTDDGIIVESFSAVTLDIVRDTLWEGSATSGNISLSGKMSDYDEIEFVFQLNSNGIYNISEIVTPSVIGQKYLFSFTGGDARWATITGVTDTGFTLTVNGIALIKVIGKKDAYVSRSLEIEDEITQYSTNYKAAGAAAVYNFLSGVNIVVCTQQEYDDMATHNPTTLYIIND